MLFQEHYLLLFSVRHSYLILATIKSEQINERLTFEFKLLNIIFLPLNKRIAALRCQMAQPVGILSQDNRTDMGIPVFWTTASSDPPWNFKVWPDQFFVAVTVKENVNPEIILEDPKPVIKEPEPRPETPRMGEDAVATAAREARE